MITSPYTVRVSLLATFVVSCKNYEVIVEKLDFLVMGVYLEAALSVNQNFMSRFSLPLSQSSP
jgi:hypothetical protein